MKIPNIYTEPNDEITSVIERLKSSHEPIVALVLPKGSPLGLSIVNLKLVRKAAQDAQKDVIIVSTDSITKNLGVQLGLTVVKNEKEVAAAASGDFSEDTAETPVIAGVRIHRYYNEEAVNPEPEIPQNAVSTENIIVPKELTRPEGKGKKAIENLATLSTPSQPVSQINPTEPPLLEVEKSPLARRTIAIIDDPTLKTVEPQSKAQPTPQETAKAVKNGRVLPPKSEKKLRKRWPIVFATILLLMLTASLFVLPVSTITITTQSAGFDKNYTLQAVPGGVGETMNASELIVSSSATVDFKPTGSKLVGTNASGTATIFNSQDSAAQELPAGAVITANGRTFTTQNSVTVPGVQVKSGVLSNGSVSVAITANDVGAESNMQNVLGTITSPKTALFAQVTNTTGGSSNTVSVFSTQDISKAREAAGAKLLETLRAQRTEELNKAGETITNEKAERITTRETAVSKQAGDEGETGQFTVEGTLNQSYVLLSDVKNAVANRVAVEDTSGRDLKIFSIEPISSDANGSQLSVLVQAKGALLPRLNVSTKDVTGKSSEDIKTQLSALDGVSSVQISHSPTWWPSRMTSHIPALNKITITNE